MAVFYLLKRLLVGTTEMGRGHFDFGLANDRDGKSTGIAEATKFSMIIALRTTGRLPLEVVLPADGSPGVHEVKGELVWWI